MANTSAADWTAKAVAQAVVNSGKSRLQVATEAALPERTFYRRLKPGGGSFDWDELLRIAEVTGVHPSSFTPPQFLHQERTEVRGTEPATVDTAANPSLIEAELLARYGLPTKDTALADEAVSA